MMAVKLHGFRELERALSELPKSTGKGVLRKIAKGALEPMANDAAAKAPVESGALSFSVSVSEKRTRRASTRSKPRFTGGGFKSDPTKSIDMAMGPAGGQGALNYASFVEFGTVDTPAQPYMRPAWDGGAMRALEYIKDNLWREIDGAAKRVAKRRLKVGL